MSFSDYKAVPLQSLLKENRKISYGIVQPGNNVEIGIPIIKVNNIVSGLTKVDELCKVSYEIEEKYKKTRLKGGELVVSLVGTVGECAIIPIEFAGCNLVRAVANIPIKNNGMSTLY